MAPPHPEPHLILIAEDEPVASMALRAQLEALGFRVLGPARNADQAVALGRCFPVDLALFDFRMPGRSGIDAALDLFHTAPTPVALLTGFGASDLPKPMPRPPIFGVLNKPVDLAELRAGIENALAAFQRWRDDNPDAHVREARQQRILIGRAVDRIADGPRTADAAVQFLERALHEATAPIDLATTILGETAP
jgi:DNA-binding NarL/FixJ family response regulator